MLVNVSPDQMELIVSSLKLNTDVDAQRLAICLNRIAENYSRTGDPRTPNTDQPTRQFRVNPRQYSHGRN
jgi:hypothetical protein